MFCRKSTCPGMSAATGSCPSTTLTRDDSLCLWTRLAQLRKQITAAGVGAVAGLPSTVLNSVGFSVQLRAQDISGALGTGQGVMAPVPGVSSLHTHSAHVPKAPCLPSC